MRSLHCINWKHLGTTFFLVGFLFFFCEVLIYYVVLLQCTWPQINTKYPILKTAILADPHLLGPRHGHWFDKLRREWQMYRAFQTMLALHYPQIVFILGDVFDEGYYCTDEEFAKYVKRFHNIFSASESTKIYTVIGNHDIGFHYRITPKLKERFERAFNISSVEMLNIQGNIFVLVNSMALEGDKCYICKAAEAKLKKISDILQCTKHEKNISNCDKIQKLPQYSQPIFLQHFPLYRPSDENCNEPDSAPEEVIAEPFRETWECLSKDSTEKVLNLLKPRVVFAGHTHHGCITLHSGNVPEWTVPSFSWRNKNNPSFILAAFAPDTFAVKKCYMPKESTVINIYMYGTVVIFIWIYITRKRFFTFIDFKYK